MNENNIMVKILIPVYKLEFDDYEITSLKQCCKILADYPVVFVKPVSLDLSHILNAFPQTSTESFDDTYFNSLFDYNRLMLSSTFYERFSDCEYILIYQLDAYVFKDELKKWCRKNYDYIGAPFLIKPKYHRFFPYVFLRIKAFFYLFTGRPCRPVMLGDKIGNGGFSLRKVKSHLKVTLEKRKKINYFLERSKQHSEYNEDVFCGTQNPEFSCPDLHEAITFSIDDYPAVGLKMNNGNLPFGCHGWSKPERLIFWKDIIYT
jgi:hypothetical protein